MKKLISLLCLVMMALAAYAVPANPKPATITQPDGTQLSIRLIGDEFYSYNTTLDGYTIIKNARGAYEYARLQNATLVGTGVLAHNLEQRTAAETSLLKSLSKNITDRAAINEGNARRAKRDQASKIQRYDYSKFRGLIILVEYTDVQFSMDDPATFYSHMANDENFTGHYDTDGTTWINCTGSVRDYFDSQSSGRFKPHFDVVGPVKVNYKSTDHKRTSSSTSIFAAALNAVNASVNFADYDTDNNGTVDMVYFLCAGFASSYGGNDGNLLWPHRSSFYGYTRYDNKYVRDYACSTEIYGWQNTPSTVTIEGIGTFCHEFSHVLGLPDLYDTDYETNGQSHHPDSWDIMSGGNHFNSARTPCSYTIWERYSLGWANPPVLSTTGTYTLNPVNTSNEGFILKSPTDNEFFMIENRQKTGWDAYLPGHGMTIVRVDSTNTNVWSNNKVNCNPAHNYYEMIRAGNATSGDNPSDPFPGTAGVLMIGDKTYPSLKNWRGLDNTFAITQITESNGVISFKLEEANKLKCLVEDFESMATSSNTGLKNVEGWFTNWTFTRSNVASVADISGGSNVVAMKQSSAITSTEPIYYNAYQAYFNVFNPTNVTGKFTFTYTTDGSKWHNAKSATGSTTQEVPANTNQTLHWVLDLTNTQPVRYRVTMTAGNKNSANYIDDFTIFYTGEQGTGDRVEGDVNGDGKVDVADITIIINILLGKDTASKYDGRADINGDGIIDVQDINTEVNIITGKNTGK